jgi:HPt (histidine-containing phosphotransfer) domain-containing protein
MDERSDSGVDADIQAARAEFARRLVIKAAHLEALVARSDWVEVRRAAHKLCGSAGVYGFGTLGVIASAIEEVLRASESGPDSAAQREIRIKLDEMRIEAERASQEMQ